MKTCDWCNAPMTTQRADAVCCSVRCRQARHRFARGSGALPVAGGRALRLAYADPPYPGLSARYYADHEDFAGEVDHAALIRRLSIDFDGWALSTSARALPEVLASCPPGVRVAAWHRWERPTRSAWPLNAWEPVIYSGGRQTVAATGQYDGSVRDASGVLARRVDSLVYRPGVRTTDPNRVTGAKPAEFCRWIFALLGAQAGDEFVDVFPGSGGVGRAWRYASQAAEGDASPEVLDDASRLDPCETSPGRPATDPSLGDRHTTGVSR